MAKTPVQTQHIDQELSSLVTSFVNLPKIAAPFTTIVNRATVTDFSQDLMPRMGIERIMVQNIQEVQGELGSNGERIFKPINDIHDQVRFAGQWSSSIGAGGLRIVNGSASDYVEITFYGTGLNVLTNGSNGFNFTQGTDGAAQGANLATSGASNILNSRIAGPNTINKIVSGLSLGLHTTKIALGAGGIDLYGFEILNETTSLQLTPGSAYIGSKKLYKTTLSTDSYNSNFETTYGTPGTKGGRVVVYQKSDGTIGKAIQYTDSTQLNISSASHTNESIIRAYHFREFGAGRTDDFSLDFTFGSPKAFTLDDGTTSLQVSSAAAASNVYASEGQTVRLTTAATLTFTFVGTGLDVTLADNNSGRSIDISVDGSSIGTLSFTSTGSLIRKVVSGLPYGTHIVKFTQTTGANPGFINFITYAPKKPAIPAGAVELADYCLMANYAAGTGDQSGPLSSGVLVKSPVRELIYAGTNWQTPVVSIGQRTGWYTDTTSTSADADYFSYVFVGTGVELYLSYSSIAQTGTLTIDGVSPISGVAVTNGGSYSAGIVTLAGGGNQVQITGLTYGSHTVKLSKHSTNDQLQVMGVGVIALIHAHKSNNPGCLQAALTIGSCTVSDNRSFSTKVIKSLNNWTQAIGVTSGPTTSSGSFVPLQDMTCVVKTTGNPIEIIYSVAVSTNTINGGAEVICFVDGVAAGVSSLAQFGATGLPGMVTGSLTVPAAAGTHIVQMFWSQAGPASTATASSTRRMLKVREIS